MDKKNIILVLIVILVIFVVFSAFRPGLKTAAKLCVDCDLPEDCEETCYSGCLKKGYDVVTSIGVVEDDGSVSCNCKCESYLNNLLRGK